jgi:hypothetical protein
MKTKLVKNGPKMCQKFVEIFARNSKRLEKMMMKKKIGGS